MLGGLCLEAARELLLESVVFPFGCFTFSEVVVSWAELKHLKQFRTPQSALWTETNFGQSLVLDSSDFIVGSRISVSIRIVSGQGLKAENLYLWS